MELPLLPSDLSLQKSGKVSDKTPDSWYIFLSSNTSDCRLQIAIERVWQSVAEKMGIALKLLLSGVERTVICKEHVKIGGENSAEPVILTHYIRSFVCQFCLFEKC